MIKTDLKWPKVSIITPTLNSQRTLELCLSSISEQDYGGKVEIVIADGGSMDNTVKIARKYGAKIYKNQLKTGEAGKAVGASYASGQIMAFIDSDNVLPEKNWLTKMVQPFLEDNEIVASEPLYFTYRKNDSWLTRYFALLGMGDPLSLFIGYYDRYSFVSNKWTELNINYQENSDYLILWLDTVDLTVGANGFLIRANKLKDYPVKDYLFDIDVLKFLAKDKTIKMAKVKTGIIHLFSGDISTFIRKQRRRVKDFLYYQRSGMRVQQFKDPIIFWGVTKFLIANITVLPLLIQAFGGFSRKRDFAWFFHPFACWLTLYTYGIETVNSFLKPSQQIDRKKWSQ